MEKRPFSKEEKLRVLEESKTQGVKRYNYTPPVPGSLPRTFWDHWEKGLIERICLKKKK